MPLLGTARCRLLTSLRWRTWGALVSHNPVELNLSALLFSLSSVELLSCHGVRRGFDLQRKLSFKGYCLLHLHSSLQGEDALACSGGVEPSSLVFIWAAVECRRPQNEGWCWIPDCQAAGPSPKGTVVFRAVCSSVDSSKLITVFSKGKVSYRNNGKTLPGASL